MIAHAITRDREHGPAGVMTRVSVDVSGRLLRLVGLCDRALEPRLGPLELEREQEQPDRDDGERGAGEDEHGDAREQDGEAGDDEQPAHRLRPPQMALLVRAHLPDEVRDVLLAVGRQRLPRGRTLTRRVVRRPPRS